MSKPMPKITGLVARAAPEAVEAAQKLPKLSGSIEGLVLRQEGEETQGDSSFSAMVVPLTKLRRSPYQNRNVDETHVADLAEIISTDGLNQPITVRYLEADDAYEIIAGEHRFEACKLLGHEAIPVFVKNTDDLGAARSLFFDNLHQKNYTDYEVYKGFKKLKEMDPSTSIRTLAKDTGWSNGRIQKIMSFEKLPAKAHEILEGNPEVLGGNAAQELARHTEAGFGDMVVEAIELIRDERLTQVRASAWIESRSKPRERKPERVLTLPNGKEFCAISRKGSVLSLRLAKNISAAEIEQKIFDFLQSQADTPESGDGD